MTFRWNTLWLAVALVLSACSVVPLSTMWKMRSFSAGDFARIQPAELRVKILLPQGFTLDLDKNKPALQFRITTARGPTEGKLELTKVSEADVVEKTGAKHEYVLKFADESLATFATLQKLARGVGEGTPASLNVGCSLKEIPPGVREGHITVSLLLFPEDGYFVLLDNLRLQFPDEAKK
jgi:hypothetical protein